MGLDRAGEAYFSPDGKRICFQAYPTGKQDYQIYVMNLDGSDLKMVSTGVGATTCAFFHPGGEKLIFAANHHDLRKPVGPNSGEAHRPRGGGHGHGDEPQEPPPAAKEGEPGRGHDRHRPGGSVTGGGQESHGQHQGGSGHGGDHSYVWKYFPGMDIWEYTFATGQLRRLTTTDGYDAECSYSPNGKQIVFASFRDGDQEIYICDADGGNARRITYAKGGDGGPFFSPDGQRICYRSDRHGDGNLQVFVNNLEGTAEHDLTGHDVFHWCPFWHRSGKWLVYTRADFRGRPNFDLYLLRDDGSETHRVTTDQAFDGLPVFSPDGKYIMWTSTRGGQESPQIFVAEFTGLTPSGELMITSTDTPAAGG